MVPAFEQVVQCFILDLSMCCNAGRVDSFPCWVLSCLVFFVVSCRVLVLPCLVLSCGYLVLLGMFRFKSAQKSFKSVILALWRFVRVFDGWGWTCPVLNMPNSNPNPNSDPNPNKVGQRNFCGRDGGGSGGGLTNNAPYVIIYPWCLRVIVVRLSTFPNSIFTSCLNTPRTL